MNAYSNNRHRRSLKRAMLRAVTPSDISEIMKLQVFLALKGDPMAVREVLDRTIGRPGSVEVEDASPQAMPMVDAEELAQQEALEMLRSIPYVPETRRLSEGA